MFTVKQRSILFLTKIVQLYSNRLQCYRVIVECNTEYSYLLWHSINQRN